MLEVLAPTFFLVGIGWFLGRLGRIPSQPLAALAFWILSPALIFESLRTADLAVSGAVVLFALLHMGGMGVLAWGVGKVLFAGERDAQVAAWLAVTFGNCGNLGLPLLLFAYGPEGLRVGTLFLSTQLVLLSTVGVGMAAWGQGNVLGQLLRAPWLYAMGAAFLARWAGIPAVIARATALVAQGAIPLFLLLLGLELAQVREVRQVRPALILAVLRLGGGSVLAWSFAGALRVEGVLRGSLVLEGSVPSAVNSLLLASQYGRRPDLAASVVFLSTIASLGTLSLTLFLLGAAR